MHYSVECYPKKKSLCASRLGFIGLGNLVSRIARVGRRWLSMVVYDLDEEGEILRASARKFRRIQKTAWKLM